MNANARRRGMTAMVLIVSLLAACQGPPQPLATPTATRTPKPTAAPPTSTPEPTQPAPTDTPAPPTETPVAGVQEAVEITVEPDAADPAKATVCARGLTTGTVYQCATVGELYAEHYHNAEYHAPSLYVIRRVGDATGASADWMDELWRYDAGGAEARVYAAQGLDFRAAPDNSVVAVHDAQAGTLVFVDAAGEPVQAPSGQPVTIADAGDSASPGTGPRLEAWSGDSRAFWFSRLAGPAPQSFHRVDASTWEVTGYDVAELGIAAEYDLDPDRGKLVYSTCPMFFDADSAQAFAESDQEVVLAVYDLATGSSVPVTSAIAICFDPEWVDGADGGERRIAFDDPAGEGRVTVEVE